MSADIVVAIAAAVGLALGATSLVLQLLSRDERRRMSSLLDAHRKWHRDHYDLPDRLSRLSTEFDLVKEHLNVDVVSNPEKYRHVPAQIVISHAPTKTKTRRRRS